MLDLRRADRRGADLRDAILPTAVPRLHIAPSTLDLSGFELEIGQRARSRVPAAQRARDAQHGHRRRHDYTYVLVDCPPSLNLLTVNAMAAAERDPGAAAMRVLRARRSVAAAEDRRAGEGALNPELTIHGIVLTMFDARNNLSSQVVADVREFMGAKVYDTVIPRNVRVSEAPSYGKPVLIYDLKCVGSEAYLRLATEIIQRESELAARS